MLDPPSNPLIEVSPDSPFPWIERGNGSLRCSVNDGNPPVFYEWSSPAGVIAGQTSNILSLTSLTKNDYRKGYSCKVSNAYTIAKNLNLISQTKQLDVELKQRIKKYDKVLEKVTFSSLWQVIDVCPINCIDNNGRYISALIGMFVGVLVEGVVISILFWRKGIFNGINCRPVNPIVEKLEKSPPKIERTLHDDVNDETERNDVYDGINPLSEGIVRFIFRCKLFIFHAMITIKNP
ncbi:hypothetical protein KUTeg_010626 [Tegillarca granosa]|uniref:Ig-like domain-containing protein n=1 Tax=Tegillarca granosa TaxID=220873 RepID=A0ABQ9F344_TEGGR|nr:hypothetical protein KUTeg_010626 [Tegillarca granosa]